VLLGQFPGPVRCWRGFDRQHPSGRRLRPIGTALALAAVGLGLALLLAAFRWIGSRPYLLPDLWLTVVSLIRG